LTRSFIGRLSRRRILMNGGLRFANPPTRYLGRPGLLLLRRLAPPRRAEDRDAPGLGGRLLLRERGVRVRQLMPAACGHLVGRGGCKLPAAVGFGPIVHILVHGRPNRGERDSFQPESRNAKPWQMRCAWIMAPGRREPPCARHGHRRRPFLRPQQAALWSRQGILPNTRPPTAHPS